MSGFGLILAGGLSQRLFPFYKPKPLLKSGDQSLLEGSLLRLARLDRTFIVTNASVAQTFDNYFQSTKSFQPEYLIEQEPRDTAAAVGFALRELNSKPEWVAILSADQYLSDSMGFQKFLVEVEKEIKRYPDSLFVSGSPSHTKAADTHSSFGWILPTGAGDSDSFSLSVKEFVEKPVGEKLNQLRESKALINAGMFFGRYETFIKAYEEFYPEVLNPNCVYSELEKKPIDRAIFEKYPEVRVFPFPFQWEDLGTWEMIHKQLGSHNFVNSKSESVFVWNEDLEKEVHIYGMKDIAVVNSGNKILVIPLSETSKLKDYLKTS